MNQDLNKQLVQVESSLKEIIVNNLTKIAGLKCVGLPLDTFKIWYKQIKEDLDKGNIENIDKGFDNLLRSKCYGGLDYAVFYRGAEVEGSKTNLF